jgi:hypothetical protein
MISYIFEPYQKMTEHDPKHYSSFRRKRESILSRSGFWQELTLAVSTMERHVLSPEWTPAFARVTISY